MEGPQAPSPGTPASTLLRIFRLMGTNISTSLEKQFPDSSRTSLLLPSHPWLHLLPGNILLRMQRSEIHRLVSACDGCGAMSSLQLPGAASTGLRGIKYTHDALCTKTKTTPGCSSMRHLQKLPGAGVGLPLPDFCFHNSGVNRSETTKQQPDQRVVWIGEETVGGSLLWSQRSRPQWKCAVGCSLVWRIGSTSGAADPPIGGWLQGDTGAGFEPQSPDPGFLQVLALRLISLEILRTF